MKKIYLIGTLMILITGSTTAQQLYQYFDGADTTAWRSLLIQMDTDSANIWQIGRPQKAIFNRAATIPNALVTDTINVCPPNNTSRFSFKVVPVYSFGVLAVQWKQKLDMDLHHSGGVIEYSVDTGTTWHNVFNDPHVYNFYGFQSANKDTLLSGEYAFSGTDTTWRDIWMCFEMSWLGYHDSAYFRFTFKSDSVTNPKEGWLIDNMVVHMDLMHPVKEVTKDYFNVYPNPTKDIVNVEIQKIMDFHIIENMKLIGTDGKIIREWTNIPTKFWFNMAEYAEGVYYLKVKTNIKSETIPIIVKRN
ncbi:MAG: hypothetical protein JWO06_638 [Bacteroidota bacterium]|nr:hypothetical protein [Bacteroidota bacterium]